MVTVELDQLEGLSSSHKLIEGWAITRSAIVTGLAGVTGSTSVQTIVAGSVVSTSSVTMVTANTSGGLIQNVEAAMIAAVGNRGAACADIVVNNFLDEFLYEFITADAVRVRIVYKGYQYGVYEFKGSLSQIESNLDVNGNVLKVQYKYPTDYPDPLKRGKVITQGGTVPRQVPESAVTVRFPVTNGYVVNGVPRTAQEAASWLCGFQGYINKSPWTILLLDGNSHCWKCTDVTAPTRDGGSTYDVSMTFTLRPTGWDPLVYFIDPGTGKPPQDLVAPGGSMPPGQTLPGYYYPQEDPEREFPVFTFPQN